MTASTSSYADLVVIGVNHRTCSDDLRQQIYVDDAELADVFPDGGLAPVGLMRAIA